MMKVKETLNLYDLVINYEIKTKAKKKNKKTEDEIIMDKLNLSRRLKNCIKIKESKLINKRERC